MPEDTSAPAKCATVAHLRRWGAPGPADPRAGLPHSGLDSHTLNPRPINCVNGSRVPGRGTALTSAVGPGRLLPAATDVQQQSDTVVFCHWHFPSFAILITASVQLAATGLRRGLFVQ